jgi:hypothetical protein
MHHCMAVLCVCRWSHTAGIERDPVKDMKENVDSHLAQDTEIAAESLQW